MHNSVWSLIGNLYEVKKKKMPYVDLTSACGVSRVFVEFPCNLI